MAGQGKLNRIKKWAFILSAIAFICFFIWTTYLWRFFKSNFAGSYPTTENWTIPAEQSKIIKAIYDLKKEHPELEPPNERFASHRTERYWYLEKFHYGNTNEDIEIYLRPTVDNSYTVLGFVSVMPHQDTLTPPEQVNYCCSKDINKDFSYFENRRQIRKFEQTILNPLMEKMKLKAEER